MILKIIDANGLNFHIFLAKYFGEISPILR